MQAVMKPMSCSKLEQKTISKHSYWEELKDKGRTRINEKSAYTTVISKLTMFPASTVSLTSL